jgi:glycosyltransferase involved in cell wall biosynthesis
MRIRFPVIRNFSGADIYFERLAQGMAAQGWEAELHFYPHLLEFMPYGALRPFLSAEHDCGLVHSKAEYGWLFARRKKPLVVTLAHSVFDPSYESHKSIGQRLYHNLKLRKNITKSFAVADRIVTVSHFSAGRIAEAFGREDVRVIHNGVDEDCFRPADSPLADDREDVRLLFVGNRTARKGFDLLAPILSRLGPGFVLEYTGGLRTRTVAPPHPAMRPLGRLSRADLVEAYQQSDILIFPSRLEGFGYPVAEAMACGKPVVCTNYASLPELVEEGQGGYLCPVDDVEAFAERIRHLGKDADLRRRMGRYNRAKVEREFSMTRCLQQYATLYKELLCP